MQNLVQKIILIFSFIVFTHVLFAQSTNYPEGGYKNYLELKSKQSSIPFTFRVEKRTNDEIVMSGGADYRIESTDKSVKKKDIKKTIYAISTGDTLYLNCYMQLARNWYSKIISEGKYLVFFGPVGPGYAGNTSGSSGAIAGAVEGGMNAKMRNLYVLDTELSYPTAKPVNKTRLEKMLNPYPDFLQQFNSENEKDNPEVLLEYIVKINEEYYK